MDKINLTRHQVHVQPKVEKANLLQLKEIERFRFNCMARGVVVTMEQAARIWVDKNAETWRHKHPFAL